MAVDQIPEEDIMKHLIHLSALLVGVLLVASPAHAQQNCGPRAALIEALSELFGETRTGYGLGTGNSVVEVYSSAQTGSWSILVTNAQGVSCLVAAGQAWATVKAVTAPEGDPL